MENKLKHIKAHRESVEKALVEFVERASSKNATSEEVQALPEVVEILFKYCLS